MNALTHAPRRRAWIWLLAALLAALALASWATWRWIDQGLPLPLDVSINGEAMLDSHEITTLPATDKAALAAGLALAAVLVPLALALALAAVLAALLLVLLLAVALPLALGSALMLLALSPLLALGWLLWRAFGRSTRSATIAA
jgi:hypothetical protein